MSDGYWYKHFSFDIFYNSNVDNLNVFLYNKPIENPTEHKLMIKAVFFDIDGIWLSIVVAEVMAVVISVVFLIIKRKKFHY